MQAVGSAAVLPPGDFDGLRHLIGARYAGLSTRLRQIAEYALANPEDIALETVAVVAARAGVQPSALVRFAQAFGYDGFSEMQRVFRRRLVERVPRYRERLRVQALEESRSPQEVVEHFVAAGHQALEHLKDDLDGAALERARHAPLGRRDRPSRRPAPRLSGRGLHGLRPQPPGQADAAPGRGRRHAGPAGARHAPGGCADGGLLPSLRAGDAGGGGRGPRPWDPARGADRRAPCRRWPGLGDAVLLVEDAEVRTFRALTASMCLATALVIALGQRLVSQGGSIEAG